MKIHALLFAAIAIFSTSAFAAQPMPSKGSGESLRAQCAKWSYARTQVNTRGFPAQARLAEIQRCVDAGGPSKM
jgi:hypothetical protein